VVSLANSAVEGVGRGSRSEIVGKQVRRLPRGRVSMNQRVTLTWRAIGRGTKKNSLSVSLEGVCLTS